MAKFLSEEWINLYKEEWNKNEKLKDGLKTFSAKIKYYIEGQEDKAVHLVVENGIAIEAGKADNNTKYDFEMWATEKDWKILANGEMGPKAAMLTKKLKFKGSMITAMKYMGPFEESLKMMGKIPTEW
ncbi:MAG: SCP2 sterol-binding domain-containing protein [Sulfurihydrogenibium sp.]|jgi:putative sterol carrier protein|uniref:SCP2 sterol-binding domain-containing protein n=1 Tax=Sulfurihydrogenibium sp. TaxID=2053621 RepID=UPI003D0D6FC0